MKHAHPPHRKNYNLPGHAHELTWTCFRGFKFLSADRTCQWLADAIKEARREHETDLWAYVFMPEHVHLILRPRRQEYDIAEIRQAIKEPVGRQAIAHMKLHAPEWLSEITVRRSGRIRRYFWQRGGGYDRNIEEPRTLEQMIEYIHMNPVRRGLVLRPEDWKWSSAAYFLRNGLSPVELDPIPADWAVIE